MQQAQHTQREGASHHSYAVFFTRFLTRLSHQVLRPFGIPLPARQAMYACIYETRSGFFEGVYASENRPLAFRDPPPRPYHSRMALPLLCWCRGLRPFSQRIEATACKRISLPDLTTLPHAEYRRLATRYHSFTWGSTISLRRLSSTYLTNHAVSPSQVPSPGGCNVQCNSSNAKLPLAMLRCIDVVTRLDSSFDPPSVTGST